jgi:hypothetical protein
MEGEQLVRVERLLTEIRDLQQAHFDRYKEFTGRLMESDQRNQQSLAEQMAYQDELKVHMLNSQRIAVFSSFGIAVVIGLAAFAVFVALSVSQ